METDYFKHMNICLRQLYFICILRHPKKFWSTESLAWLLESDRTWLRCWLFNGLIRISACQLFHVLNNYNNIRVVASLFFLIASLKLDNVQGMNICHFCFLFVCLFRILNQLPLFSNITFH